LGGEERVVLCPVRKGGREGIQKGRRDSREERPMIKTTKRQTKLTITIKLG
jgi:hypothetical protein